MQTTSRTEAPDETSTPPAEHPAPETEPSGRPWRRWLLIGSLAIILLAAVLFTVATLELFVFPSSDQPTHVNGIVSFNGADEPIREALAISLAEEGYAHVLLFSQGGHAADTACPKVPRVAVVCFVDTSGNTRGEAQWAGRYAERHHWQSLMVVPGRDQVTRARLLTQRCFSGRVVVVPISESRPALFDIVHQWGGLLDSLLIHRGC
jgi:hypothetical protein